MLTKEGAVTHIVHLMQRGDLEAFASDLTGHHADFNVTPTMVARQFYEFRKNEIRSIFLSHFGLLNAFDVVFYDGLKRRRKHTMSMRSSPYTPSPKHHLVSSMESSASNVSMAEDQLSQMVKAYFNGNGSGGNGRTVNVVEKRRRIMEITDRLFMEQQEQRQANPQIAGAAPMESILEEESKEGAHDAIAKQEAGVEMMEMVLKMNRNAANPVEDGGVDSEGDFSQRTKL